MGNGYGILFKFASPFEMMEMLLVMSTGNLFGCGRRKLLSAQDWRENYNPLREKILL